MSARDRFAAAIKSAAARANLDVHRRDLTHPARRAAAMRSRAVDLVVDVGANRGQYVDDLRTFGYTGAVVSFEPIPSVLADIAARLASDPSWRGLPYALGRDDGTVEFHVSDDTVTSSVLAPTPRLLDQIASARTDRRIEVPSRRLDSIWTDVVGSASQPMLKVDVQGFEHAVLDGLAGRIDAVALIELEMSLVELYEGGSSIHDLLPRMREAGFHIVSIDSGFVDESSGQVLDIDVLLGR